MLKKRNLIFLSLLILALLILSGCFLQPPETEGLLQGQVLVPEGTLKTKDLNGEALPNATVHIIDLATGEVIATTTTDTAGHYQVFVPAGGPYLMEAASNGIKVQQITPQVEAGIEYDLGITDCETTTTALIAQAMLDEGENLAEIDCAAIMADPGFSNVSNIVCTTIASGGDPTDSTEVNQAIQDFLHPNEPSNHILTYTVTYEGNGHTDGTVPTGIDAYQPGETVTVLGNSGNLQRMQDGISLLFTGWNTASDGSGTAYQPGNTFPMGSADIILYAQWSVLRGTGPSGGLVFYDQGSVSDGWRYLEAALTDQSKGKWGTLNFTVPGADGTDIGTGKQNTLDIVTGDSLADKAADKCAAYSVAAGAITYNDWFLPSKDEMYLMYTNLHLEGVGNFSDESSDHQYYSSSESDPWLVWYQSFYAGNQNDASKYAYDWRSRPARAFRSTSPTYLVNYHANGATGGTVPTDPYHYEPGEAVSVANNTGFLVKDNYSFDGWNTQADGNGTDRAEGSSFNMGSDNVTLYAKWIETTIDIAAIPGVTAPVTGATPVSTITETAQYTGTVTWSPDHSTFAGSTVYTASITITPKAGFTLTGVTEDFFTVSGADPVSNSANSGVVTASFPETATVAVGDSCGGGIVAYILQSGDPGYVTGEQHGLIAATSDQSGDIYWHASQSGVTGATETVLGKGKENTDTIISFYGSEVNAAKLCADYINSETGTGVYNDWFLPSNDELEKLHTNRVAIGGFTEFGGYWSSSEYDETRAWARSFLATGINTGFFKDSLQSVRAVRYF